VAEEGNAGWRPSGGKQFEPDQQLLGDRPVERESRQTELAQVHRALRKQQRCEPLPEASLVTENRLTCSLSREPGADDPAQVAYALFSVLLGTFGTPFLPEALTSSLSHLRRMRRHTVHARQP
jgi:hypothetical protein